MAMATGRVGALLGVHPQVTQLGHFGIVGRDGHDLGALVAHLGQEVRVGRARLRHVGAPGNDVRAVVPVGRLSGTSVCSPQVCGDCWGQVAVPVVKLITRRRSGSGSALPAAYEIIDIAGMGEKPMMRSGGRAS